jgi:hypothetical protein
LDNAALARGKALFQQLKGLVDWEVSDASLWIHKNWGFAFGTRILVVFYSFLDAILANRMTTADQNSGDATFS